MVGVDVTDALPVEEIYKSLVRSRQGYILEHTAHGVHRIHGQVAPQVHRQDKGDKGCCQRTAKGPQAPDESCQEDGHDAVERHQVARQDPGIGYDDRPVAVGQGSQDEDEGSQDEGDHQPNGRVVSPRSQVPAYQP